MNLKTVFTLTIMAMGFSLPSFGVDFSLYNGTFSLEVTKWDGSVFVCSSVAIDVKTLLTAAHCLEGAKDIKVTDGKIRNEAIHWDIHPEYDKDESNYHADIGIITLYRDLPYHLNFPRFGRPQKSNPLVRIGFGGREGSNLRTYISGIFILDQMDNTLVLKDKLGVPGDSGGPLFQFINGKLTLIAIHSTVEGEKSYAPIINSFVR